MTIRRSSGAALVVDPFNSVVQLDEDHPQVDRMEGDLGAICEVFKQRSDHYLTITGVRLQPGDVVVFDFGDPAEALTVQVVEVEEGRARVRV